MNTRSETSTSHKLYKTARWRKLRKAQLARRPYCECPHHKGQKVLATVVDHIKAHKGDQRLFWNTQNLQSMSKPCHDKYKQSEEKGGPGFDMGCNEDGTPLNAEHSWYN